MQELFPPLPRNTVELLQEFPHILRSVIQMQAKHFHLLPQAIEELSTRLTSERSLLQQPYWSAPRLSSAYAWYFLPWNILRLTRLLHNLDLPEPTPMPTKKNGAPMPRIFADMGSGPLSLPIALWLAKPQWRHIPLTIVCTDISPQPLAMGQKIFEALAGKESPWRIVTRRCHLEASASEIHKTEGVPWLITAANVCNELKGRHDQSTEERLEEVIEKLFSTLHAPDAHLLFVEPGTRLGGKTIVSLREVAQNFELLPVAPCPSAHQCPLDGTRTWCHFTFDIHGAPRWLTELSTKANLRKEALSLSFVLLRPSQEEQDNYNKSEQVGRIISASFRVPGVAGFARYACTAQGLALLGRAQHLPSGALVRVTASTEDTETDRKSGAFILEHKEKMPERDYADHYRHSRYDESPSHREDRYREDRYREDRYERSHTHRHEDGYAPRSQGRPFSSGAPRSENRQDNGAGKSYSRDQRPQEKRKKVIKPSKKNEKKFWEK